MRRGIYYSKLSILLKIKKGHGNIPCQKTKEALQLNVTVDHGLDSVTEGGNNFIKNITESTDKTGTWTTDLIKGL